MEIEVKGLLINILIIFLGQLTIVVMHNLNKNVKHKLSIFFASAISIICCMTFGFPVGEFIYDLRYIPLLLGTLYGGYKVGIGLYIVLNLYRLFLGGWGILVSLIASTILLLATGLILRKFTYLPIYKKMIVIVMLLQLTPVSTFLINRMLGQDTITLNQYIVYVTIFTIGTIILVYFTELLNKHILLKEQMVHFEKSVTVSHLAASIAHEIKNPLTTVKGFLQLLYVKEFDEKRRSYYKTIFSELDRAENIIHEYLTFAKPQSQDVELIDTKVEIEKALSILRPLAKKNKVEYQTELEPLMTKGIVQQFTQTLINIIKNAIEAMPDGGTLTVKLQEDQGNIKLFICDTGHGLSKEQISNLGQPYFTTKGDQGTGLGLLVSYNIIKSMGGHIEVDSKLHKGTCFILTLPLEINNQNTLNEVASQIKT